MDTGTPNESIAKRKPGSGPTAIDLFSGCGGLTLGLKQAGFRVLAAVEIDDLAAETYRANHPEVKLYRTDIRWLTPARVCHDLGLAPGELDLLAGCPPCQGFSTIRTWNGGKVVPEPRNDLVLQFTRFVKKLQPKAIMMENVPGLAKDPRFLKYAKCLERLGYTHKYDILDAANYAVPQRRRRSDLVGKPSWPRSACGAELQNDYGARCHRSPLATTRE